MGTFTANILVGSGHRNDGGINPTTTLYLNEGSKVSWVMRRAANGTLLKREMTWICTVEDTLEDAILMICYFLLKKPTITELIKEFAPEFEENRAFLYDTFTERQRKQLYASCRELRRFPKLIVTAFQGSHISSQLHRLPSLTPGDLEICTVQYSRMFDEWTNKVVERGDIPGLGYPKASDL